MLKIKVVALDSDWEVVISKNDTVEVLATKLIEQIHLEPSPNLETIIFVDDAVVDKAHCIKSQPKTVEVTFLQQFQIITNHSILGEIQFQTDYFGKLDKFARYIQQLPLFQQMKQPRNSIKFKVNNKIYIPSTTTWQQIGPVKDLKIQIWIESIYYITWNNKKEEFIYDVGQSFHEIISQIREQLKIEDVILLQWNSKEICPENLAYKENLPPNSFLSIRLPNVIKYQIKIEQQQQFEVEINKEEPISNLCKLVAQRLKLPQNQQLQLKYQEKELQPQSTIKQTKIPYNSVLTCEVNVGSKIMLRLQNASNKQYLQFYVEPQLVLKEVDKQLGIDISMVDEILYFLDGKQLDKRLTIQQLEMKPQQFLVFDTVKLQIPEKGKIEQKQEIPNYGIVIPQSITVHFKNKANQKTTTAQVQINSLIKDQFLKIIEKEEFKDLFQYSISFEQKELIPNQTYSLQGIVHNSVILYQCKCINVSALYNQQNFQMQTNLTAQLTWLENQFKVGYNIPKEFTIFHGQLEGQQEKTVEEISLQQFEFKLKVKENSPVKPHPKIRIVQPQQLKMLKFKIFITNLDYWISQEISSENQVKALAECIRSKLLLPQNLRVIFNLGNDILDDEVYLSQILEGEFKNIQALTCPDITISFQEKTKNEVITIQVLIADKLVDTIQKLHLENSRFYYQDKQLEDLNISYGKLLIMHKGTIYFERKKPIQMQEIIENKIQHPEINNQQQIPQVEQVIPQKEEEKINNALYDPSDDEEDKPQYPKQNQNVQPNKLQLVQNPGEAEEIVSIQVIVGGKTFLYQVGPKTTISDLKEQIKKSIAFANDKQEQEKSYGLKLQGKLLPDGTEIGSLAKMHKDIVFSYVEIQPNTNKAG